MLAAYMNILFFSFVSLYLFVPYWKVRDTNQFQVNS